jgi:hypothetical protein
MPPGELLDESTVVMQPPPSGARRWLVRPALALGKDDMRRLGLRRSRAIARTFNRRADRYVRFRRTLYEERFAELLAGAGGPPGRRIEMRDGFAIDESRSLPHLDRLLAAGEDIIERYAGRQWEFEKPFLQDISPESAVDHYPAVLDFITSPEVVAAAAPCFGYVPALPGTIPEGFRLMESSTRFDPDADGPWRQSQLYHLDYHSTPTVYVIVAIRDIGPDDGPLHFLGAAASRKVVDALGYGRRGVPYRLTDEVVYSIVDEGDVHRFAAPAGTVLFIESSACFHYGSRRPAAPRYQAQYSFTSPVRNDFMELWRPQRVYPVGAADSDLRRLVLDRSLLSLSASDAAPLASRAHGVG